MVYTLGNSDSLICAHKSVKYNVSTGLVLYALVISFPQSQCQPDFRLKSCCINNK